MDIHKQNFSILYFWGPTFTRGYNNKHILNHLRKYISPANTVQIFNELKLTILWISDQNIWVSWSMNFLRCWCLDNAQAPY